MSLDVDRQPQAHLMKAALEASGVVGVWEWDHHRRIAIYDRGAARYLAGDPDLAGSELAAEQAMMTIHPDDRPWLREQSIRAASSGEFLLSEYRVLLHDGVRWILSRGRTDLAADGQPGRTRGILIDITESREAGRGYVIEAQSAPGNPLNRAADLAVAIKRTLTPGASPALSLIVDMLLLQLGREIAQDPDSAGTPVH